jgi:di/tricarboxylate transporter
MPPDHIILYCLLAAVVVLLVTEWIPLEATALLTMGILALTGLVPAEDALAGFSSPAVITIWAVFMLSGALDRTGVAERIGHGLKRLAGRTEIGLTAVLMLGAGLMSAVMNNVAVAALLLPVTMDLARANHIPPSRLLLPPRRASAVMSPTVTSAKGPNCASCPLRASTLPKLGECPLIWIT